MRNDLDELNESLNSGSPPAAWVPVVIPFSHLYDEYEQHARALFGSGGYMPGLVQISMDMIALTQISHYPDERARSIRFPEIREHLRRYMLDADLLTLGDRVKEERLLYGLIDLTAKLQTHLQSHFLTVFGHVPLQLRFDRMFGRDLVVCYPLPLN